MKVLGQGSFSVLFLQKTVLHQDPSQPKENLPRLLQTVPRKLHWGPSIPPQKRREWVVHNWVRGLHRKVGMSRKWKIYTMHWNLRRLLCGTTSENSSYLLQWLITNFQIPTEVFIHSWVRGAIPVRDLWIYKLVNTVSERVQYRSEPLRRP